MYVLVLTSGNYLHDSDHSIQGPQMLIHPDMALTRVDIGLIK